jgi:hypothetical protein
MGLDELAVHPGHIHLPQVHARARMGLQPSHHGQQTLPALGQRQRLQRPPSQPRQQQRLRSRRLLPQCFEPLRLTCLADEGQGILHRVEPDGRREPLGPLDTVVPFAPFDAHLRGVGDGAHPITHGLEAVGHFGSTGRLQAQAQRPGKGVRDQRPQQIAPVPQTLDLRAQIGRQGPVHGAAKLSAAR